MGCERQSVIYDIGSYPISLDKGGLLFCVYAAVLKYYS